jgi:acetoin utilization protein AcuB
MSKAIPTIQKYMTASPHSIGQDQPIAKADEMMRQFKIRHLPVLEGGKLLGIISDRDIRFLESFKDVDPKKTKVGDCSIQDVFSVKPESMLDEVCDAMAENKFGCAVVMDNSRLVGIFTWIDALRAMSELLKTRLHK